MKVKITELLRVKIGTSTEFNYVSYIVSSRTECRDNTDRSAYDALEFTGEKCVQMGAVCVERLDN